MTLNLALSYGGRDEGKAFIKGLKPDDRVELIYEEVFAITVE